MSINRQLPSGPAVLDSSAGALLQLLLQQALSLYGQGKFDQADSICVEVLKIHPGNFDALHLRGILSADRGDFAGSISLLEQAIQLAPQSAPAHLHLGNSLRRTGQPIKAIERYNAAIGISPAFFEAWNNLGNALREIGSLEDALSSINKALSLRPHDAEAWNNLGNVHRDLQHLHEALTCYDRALALAPEYAEAHNNRGFVLVALRRPAEALLSYARAQQIYPNYARAHLNEALCRLLLEDYAQGWPKYEWRWADIQRSQRRSFSQPQWQSHMVLAGKTILVHPEQGYGDCIQFSRYLPLLISRGARVILETPVELAALFSTIPGVQQLVDRGSPPPPFDYHCPLASLPFGFLCDDLAIPVQSPYLAVPEERVAYWQERLGPPQKSRIAITWSGSATDPLRAISLEQFRYLASSDFEFFSVQKDLSLTDERLVTEIPQITHLGGQLRDFADTAAILSLVNVVVSIDTSVAHLAGALGRPTLVLLHHSSDWRYGLSGSSCPWYPTMRLFRQSIPGQWQDVLRNVKSALLQAP